MPVKGALEFTRLTNLIDEFAAAGGNVDQVVAELLGEVKPFIQEEMVAHIKKSSNPDYEATGELADSVEVSDVQQEGNYIFVEASAGGSTRQEAAVAKEFGNTRQAAEPFIRPTFRATRTKNRLVANMKEAMQRFGLNV